MQKLFVVAMAVGLAACAGNGSILPDRNFQLEADVACRAIGGSLAALAPYRADMPAKVEATVQAVRVQSEPLCTAKTPPNTAALVGDLQRMAFDLISAEREIVQ